MMLRSLPKNLNNYICVNSDQSYILRTNDFIPLYMYDGKFYYKKTDKLIDFIRKEGFNWNQN